jgi:hypothetical protein
MEAKISMEAKIIFDDSMSQQSELESIEWLKDKVFNGDDVFWEGLTGNCALSYIKSDIGFAWLDIIGREEFGFMINHNFVDEKRQYVRYGEENSKETVIAETGGEPTTYYKKYCMPKETAWEVIEYFLKTGGRCPKYFWEVADYPKQFWEE